MTIKDPNIENRKKDHLRIVGGEAAGYREVTNGFEQYRFIHNALPEQNLAQVDTSVTFMGKRLSVPLMIVPMSGGEAEGEQLNRDLALAAQEEHIALGLGSLRPALENPACLATYAIARQLAPDVPIIANLGASQLKAVIRKESFFQMLSDIGADALSIHLNPLQEALQPEGETDFRNISETIEILKEITPLPVIVKEVGFGLSFDVIHRLKKIGVEWIDIAGAGGTSWARVEENRIDDPIEKELARQFFEWGIPTAKALSDAVKVKNCRIIASGGLEEGLDFAKAIALGASMTGAAAAFLRIYRRGGVEAVHQYVGLIRSTLRIAMFATGCRNVSGFRGNPAVIEKI